MNVRKKKHLLTCAVFFLILLGTVFLSGCQKKERDVIGIAEQYGIAYAPLNIMKELGILEEKLPGVTIEWKQFGGPTAIRESMEWNGNMRQESVPMRWRLSQTDRKSKR